MILVTGATGCIGSNLTRELVRNGERVAILRLPGDDLAALDDVTGEVDHRIADVRDRELVDKAMAGVERVFHLAAYTVPANRFAGLLHEVNVTGTENVMRAALRRGARVVHTSSVSAVGFPRKEPADEGFCFNGHGHAYAVSKRLGELVVQRYVQEGLEAVIVNPAVTIAPGGDLRHGWGALVVGLRRRRLPAYPGGSLSVASGADVVEAHLAAMEKGGVGERYIVSSEDLSYGSLARRVATVIGAPGPRVRLPDGMVRAAAHCAATVAPLIRDPRRQPLLTPENVPLLVGTMYYRAAKARRAFSIGGNPLDRAIEELASWCDRRQGSR